MMDLIALLLAADLAGNPIIVSATSGCVAAMLAFVGTVFNGKIVVPTSVYNEEKAGRQKWEAEAMRLNALLQDKAIPAIVTMSTLQAHWEKALSDSTMAIHDLETELDRMRRDQRR